MSDLYVAHYFAFIAKTALQARKIPLRRQDYGAGVG
jgi:hypothetical protein